MDCLNYIRISLLVALLSFSSFSSFSQRIVNDVQTQGQVLTNTLLQMVVENQQNSLIDTINNLQEEILYKTTAILASKELYIQTLQNIKGFEAESLYYREIAITGQEIGDLTSQILSAVSRSNLINKANATFALWDLVGKSTQCIHDFVAIVTNAKVKNPLRKENSIDTEEKNDGHNLLDRYERMNLASQLSLDLKRIKAQMKRILFLCRHGDWTSLINQLDRKTWVSQYQARSVADQLVRKWSRLTHK